MKSNVTVGVINWDCSLPADTTFFGYHATKSLSPEKYRNVTPYYADVLQENRIDYHVRTVEEYEKELQYAIDAGIDYFAYCWYGETPETSIRPQKEESNYVSDKVWELSVARKLHMASKLKNQIKLCAILPAHPMTEEELDNLADVMGQAYYQKLNGKPLVYIFAGYDTEKIAAIRKACAKRGLSPHVVIIASQPQPDCSVDYTQADGVSAYACCAVGVETYAELAEQMVKENEERKDYGLEIIPFFTVGWNPSPRIDNVVPWIQYPEEPYAPLATEEELLAGAKMLLDWVKINAEATVPSHVLTFAWNEFEEGGHICPTWGKDCPDTNRLEAFRKVTAYWKENW